MKKAAYALLVFTAGPALAAGSFAASVSSFRPTGSIPLDGVEGRIDHLALDADNGRLYVAALGNNTVEVVDLAHGRRIDTIPGLEAGRRGSQ